MLLTTPGKDDFFKTRLRKLPEESLNKLNVAIQEINQEINQCDAEIEKWQGERGRMKNYFLRILKLK